MERDDGGLEVWLPSQSRIPTLVIGVVLLAYSLPAMLGGTPVVIEGLQRYSAGADTAFAPWVVFVFYAAWIAVGIGPAVAGTLLVSYQFLGWERIHVDGRGLSLKREVFGIGRRRRFKASGVRDLRLTGPLRLKNWFVSTGTIAFEYGTETHRFGASLSEAEAAEVLQAITAEAGLYAREVTGDGG